MHRRGCDSSFSKGRDGCGVPVRLFAGTLPFKRRGGEVHGADPWRVIENRTDRLCAAVVAGYRAGGAFEARGGAIAVVAGVVVRVVPG